MEEARAIGDAPAVLGWMGEAFSLRTAFLMLCVFYILAATLTIVVRRCFFEHGYIREG